MEKYKIEIKWAVIFMIMTLAWMGVERLLGLHDVHIDKHPVYTNFIAIPAIIIYVLALLEKRKKVYGGNMTYKQGFMTGLAVTLIVAVLSPVTQMITTYWITPDYFNNAINYTVEQGKASREAAEAHFNLKAYVGMGFIGSIFMGLITTAIVAIFTRKNKT